ncbi:MAG: hypothetical protein LW710_01200 [Burkholderiales bacterium]|jgi:protein tyrosine phosphatase|uniref:protein-tyrosine phosphatase family protein n=1 Tax=Limnobacter sp. TaxID=2003368 RepID=UPI0039BD0A7C|nr:hypothetical protein [Burkholderiales bacterium]
MDKVTAVTRTNSFDAVADLPKPVSRGDLSSQNVLHKLHLNRDTNQDISWVGRLDPCNRSHQLPLLLQELLKQLDSGHLNAEQRMLARHDLQMIAVRCFCEGHVGQGHELLVTFQGKTLQLDGVHLAQLLQNSPDDLPAGNAFHDMVSQGVHFPAKNQAIKLINPEQSPNLQSNHRNFSPANNFKGPLYAEMKMGIAHSPLPNFDSIQKNYAKQVIDRLPLANQGKLRGVPAQLIGVDAYIEVLRAAAHEKKLPSPLMEFRESCEDDNALKRAIYANPHIAARILGLSLNSTPNNQEAASLIARPIVQAIIPHPIQASSFTKFFQRIANFGKTETMRLVGQAFKKLDEFQGFDLQEMAEVPTCFPDIKCPQSTAVDLNSSHFPPLKIHANRVSMGNGRYAIAAMQPVHSDEGNSSNLAGFYQLLAGTANANGAQVIDLRSGSDFQNGSYDYCPPLGESRSIQIPESQQTIRVSTLAERDLPKANCKEITVNIQIDDHPPKEIKVVQFRHWPDHGVIKPDELRALRQVAAQPLEKGQNLITHCRAGVGRTGTLLAYEHLYNDLIEHGHGKALIDTNGKVNRKRLLLAITQVVAQGRIERGPYFVQKEDQFKLLYTTLKADLLANSNNLNSETTARKASTTETTLASLPGQTINLDHQTTANLLAEPADLEVSQQHWNAILESGEDVIEMISTPSRLVGATNSASTGLGLIFNQLILAKQHGDNIQNTQFGNHRLLEIIPVDAKKPLKEGQLIHSQQFLIRYQAEGESEVKSISYTQFLAPFDGKKLTAKQLNDTLEELNQNDATPKLICSTKGIGRPSALLVAQAMQAKIREGAINNDKQLIDQIDKWAKAGRSEFGPLFINSREQREQLIILGQSWLANKKAGEKITSRVTTSNEDIERSKKLKAYMSA